MDRKTAIRYGLTSGLIIVSSWFITALIWEGGMHFAGSEILGYAVMLLALSAVFIGVKNFRDKTLNGTMSFKKGFLAGLGIVLVASTIYVVGWMIYMPNFAPDFIDKYMASQIEQIQSSDAGEAEKKEKIETLRKQIEDYKKPHIMMAATFAEIFPLGLIVTLISALILKTPKVKNE